MMPLWKLKREFTRLCHQILALPQSLLMLPRRLSEPRRRLMHDLAFPNNLHLTEGKVALGKRLVIIVLFQPRGVSPSTIETCQDFVSAGYTPLVISNAVLSAVDQALLAETCWRVVDRPNFGYDFGAYRDGIRMIRETDITPDCLILMNDSFWCKITPMLLGRMEGLNVDLAGLLQDEKVLHDTQGGTPTRKMHIESYCLVISKKLWKTKVFQDFWDGYQLTDIKPKTIKNGEIGFSRTMSAAGFSLGALTSRSLFLAGLSNAKNDVIQQALRYAAYDDPVFKSEGVALFSRLAIGEEWRNDALDHIRRWVNRRRFNAAFPLASAHLFDASFLKKNQEKIYAAARETYLRGCEDGLIEPTSSAIITEIAESLGRTSPAAIFANSAAKYGSDKE